MGWLDCPKSPSRIHDKPIALEPGNPEKGRLSTHPQHRNNRSQDISSWASTRTDVHNSRPRYLFSKTHDLSSTDHDLRNIYQDPFLQQTFLFLYAVLELFFFCEPRSQRILVGGNYLPHRNIWYLCNALSLTSTQEFFNAFCKPWSLSLRHTWSSPHKPHRKNSSSLLSALIFLRSLFFDIFASLDLFTRTSSDE